MDALKEFRRSFSMIKREMSPVRIIAIQWLFVFFFASPLHADRVFLRSGDLIEGIVVNETVESINVQVDSSSYVMFAQREIERVERAPVEENEKLISRWEEDRREDMDGEPKKASTWLSRLSFQGGALSDVEHGFGPWLKDIHERIHATLQNFLPTGFIMNIEPIANYRREQPELYVLGFYSTLLLITVLGLQNIVHRIQNFFTSRKEKKARKAL